MNSYWYFNQFCNDNEDLKYGHSDKTVYISYETDIPSLNFSGKYKILFNNYNRDTGGSLTIPDIDEGLYFSEFIPKYQDIYYDKNERKLIIKGTSNGFKNFTNYKVTIFV